MGCITVNTQQKHLNMHIGRFTVSLHHVIENLKIQNMNYLHIFIFTDGSEQNDFMKNHES